MPFGDTVWTRAEKGGIDTMSRTTYINAITGFTLYGLTISMVIAFLTMQWHPSLIGFLGFGLAVPIVGIIIAFKSDQWFTSLMGYTLVVLGLGAIIGPTVALYKTGVVLAALMATFGVTCVMSFVGAIYPKSLENWGGYLFGGLTALIFVRVAQLIMIGMGVQETIWYMPFVEYLGALLFSLYIIYDWNRAVRLPHTLDNAVDCALAIYLDVVNLFLQFLRIFGGTGSKSKD